MPSKKAFGIGLGILCACLVAALIYLISTNGTTNSSVSASTNTTNSSVSTSTNTSPSTVSSSSTSTSPSTVSSSSTNTSPSTVSTSSTSTSPSTVVSYVNNSSFVNAICPSTVLPDSTRVLNSKGTGYLTTITGTGRTIETDHTSDGSGCVSKTTSANSNSIDATCPAGYNLNTTTNQCTMPNFVSSTTSSSAINCPAGYTISSKSGGTITCSKVDTVYNRCPGDNAWMKAQNSWNGTDVVIDYAPGQNSDGTINCNSGDFGMGISSSVNNYGTPWISRGYTRTGSDIFSSTYTKTLTSNVSCPAGSLNRLDATNGTTSATCVLNTCIPNYSLAPNNSASCILNTDVNANTAPICTNTLYANLFGSKCYGTCSSGQNSTDNTQCITTTMTSGTDQMNCPIDPFGDINYFKYNNKCYYMCSVGDNYQDKCKITT